MQLLKDIAHIAESQRLVIAGPRDRRRGDRGRRCLISHILRYSIATDQYGIPHNKILVSNALIGVPVGVISGS
jgi:hypothetical protein